MFSDEYREVIAQSILSDPAQSLHYFVFPRQCGSSVFLKRLANSCVLDHLESVAIIVKNRPVDAYSPVYDFTTGEEVVKLDHNVDVYSKGSFKLLGRGKHLYDLILCDNAFYNESFNEFSHYIAEFKSQLKQDGKIICLTTDDPFTLF